jgi:hypothetical protein
VSARPSPFGENTGGVTVNSVSVRSTTSGTLADTVVLPLVALRTMV